MIAIFGDSHIRSLSYISKDSTFYLGRGRDFRQLSFFAIFNLFLRIFILNLFICSYDCKIVSFSEPFFRDLKSVSNSERERRLSLFFNRLHLLFNILKMANCKPTHFLLPHSPDFTINSLVVSCLPRFTSLLQYHSISPLFMGDIMFDCNGTLAIKYLGFEFTNPSNYDKVHIGPYLGKSISENFQLHPNSEDFLTASHISDAILLSLIFKYFFRWNPLFTCYRYQTLLLKLLRLKSSLFGICK